MFTDAGGLVNAQYRYTKRNSEEREGQKAKKHLSISCPQIWILLHSFPLLIINHSIESIKWSNIWPLKPRWLLTCFGVNHVKSLPIPSLWVIPVHQPKHPVSCIEPGLAIHFLYDIIRFNAILPNHPTLSLWVQKSVLHICVFFAVLHTGSSLPSF